MEGVPPKGHLEQRLFRFSRGNKEPLTNNRTLKCFKQNCSIMFLVFLLIESTKASFACKYQLYYPVIILFSETSENALHLSYSLPTKVWNVFETQFYLYGIYKKYILVD